MFKLQYWGCLKKANFEKVGQILTLETAVKVSQSVFQQQWGLAGEVYGRFVGRWELKWFLPREIALRGGITAGDWRALATLSAPGCSSPTHPAWVRKVIPRLFAAHPALTHTLQEAASKLLGNWELEQMYAQLTSLSGFAEVWDGETRGVHLAVRSPYSLGT